MNDARDDDDDATTVPTPPPVEDEETPQGAEVSEQPKQRELSGAQPQQQTQTGVPPTTESNTKPKTTDGEQQQQQEQQQKQHSSKHHRKTVGDETVGSSAGGQMRKLELGWSLAPIHSFDRSIPIPPEFLARSSPPTKHSSKGGGSPAPSPKKGGTSQYGRSPLPPISTSPPRTPSPRTSTATGRKHDKALPSKELIEAKQFALLWLDEKKMASRASSRSGGGGRDQGESHAGNTSAECAASPPWATQSHGGAHIKPALSPLSSRDPFTVAPSNPSGLFEGPDGYGELPPYHERINQTGKLRSPPFHVSQQRSSSPSRQGRPHTREAAR